MRSNRFLSALALLVLVLGVSLKLKMFFGYAPDFVLALLVVFGFIFNLYETIFLSALAAWILNWKMVPGPELWWVFALALLAYFGRYFMPFERWLSLIILIGGGIFLMYLIASPSALYANLDWIFLDAVGSVVFGLLILRLFRYVYK